MAAAVRVELQFGHVGFDRREVLGHQHMGEVTSTDLDLLVEGQDAGLVLGEALGVLLAVAQADPRLGREGDARQVPVSAGLPGAVVVRLAVAVGDRVLAEVPDVSAEVLGVPVPGDLDRCAVMGDDVPDDSGGDPVGHPLGAVSRLDHVMVHMAGFHVGDAVDPAAAGGHRPARVVDLGAEVGRMEVHGLVELRETRTRPRGDGRRPGRRNSLDERDQRRHHDARSAGRSISGMLHRELLPVETGGLVPRQVGEAYEPQALGAALHGEFTDRADVTHVVLVVDDSGLERGRFLGEQSVVGVHERDDHVGVAPQDGEDIQGVAGVVLLVVRRADPGVRLHEDARLGPVDPRRERAFATRHVPVTVQRCGSLAEVPHRAGLGLGVEVAGALAQHSVVPHPVEDDAADDTVDHTCAVGGDHDVTRMRFAVGPAVDVPITGMEREPRVGHSPLREVRRRRVMWARRLRGLQSGILASRR